MTATLIGYLASLLLALSLIVTNELRFRWFNLFGCIAFIIYGIWIGAFPVLLTNAMLFLINLFYLVKIYQTKEAFDLVAIDPNSEIVAKFLAFHKKDMATFFPQFDVKAASPVCFIVLRNMAIANVFIADKGADGTATVLLDYTTPKYRDYKAATYIFEQERQRLHAAGIDKLVYTQPVHPKHAAFLRNIGFREEQAAGQTRYTKALMA
ncbi:MAG: hypothetical protein JWP69_2348 [Flaviaesturariibacter sp.]|nr:hypothetical protein [Flaviaesturariibacter sp.]